MADSEDEDEKRPDSDSQDDLEVHRRKRKENQPGSTNSQHRKHRKRRPAETGSVSNFPQQLNTGQSYACVVLGAEPGGFTVEVTLGKRQIFGYVPTHQRFRQSETTMLIFVCMHKGRALFTTSYQHPELPTRDHDR